jgi:hypothetical protein
MQSVIVTVLSAEQRKHRRFRFSYSAVVATSIRLLLRKPKTALEKQRANVSPNAQARIHCRSPVR